MNTFTASQMQKFNESLDTFIAKYGNLYPEDVIEYIKENFLGLEFSLGIAIDVMSQVYEMTGVHAAMKKNIYQDYLNYIKNYYDINCHVLDVGCGFFPSFSRKLAKEQKNGSVTAIDYDVITTDFPDIKVEKDTFTRSYDVSDVDLMIGVQPCEASEDMIYVANTNDIDLCLFLCGCPPGQTVRFEYERALLYKYYINSLKSTMELTLPSNRDYVMEENAVLPYPTFRTYRKK